MKLLRKLQDKRNAMALVLTLAILVIVTGLILAFFTRATADRQTENDRAQREAADVLAQSAGNYVIGQFLQQIATSSTPTPLGGVTTFDPSVTGTINGIVPQRTGIASTLLTDTNFSLLVMQSPQPSGAVTASDYYTTTPSSNGRSIKPSRWDKPVLNTGTATDGFWNQTSPQLPNWVYVSSTGIGGSLQQIGSNTIGRFAYNVYNIGGLLNANVAGYPSSYINSGGTAAALQGSVAGANLTLLGIQQGAVDNLVAFRTGTGSQVTGTNYINVVTASGSNGFLSTTSGTYNSNYFSSRQDLLRYAALYGTNPPITPALPYLTTFSPSLNAPSWTGTNSPSWPVAWSAAQSGSATGALTVLGSGTAANQDVFSVRCQSSGTFVHYDDNGNASYYTVNKGDPLIQHRFSLAKLPWITHTGPATISGSTISAAAIQTCFGLTWDSNVTPLGASSGGYGPTTSRWEYTALSSNGRIRRLDEVAALTGTAAREPNFFELLKAGLLWGSLGRDPGPIISNTVGIQGYSDPAKPGIDGYGFGVPPTTPGTSGSGWSTFQEMQILQIGANLIDQTTAGDCPNAIYGGSGTNAIMSSVGITDSNTLSQLQILQTVYGVKDLPYLYGFTQIYAYDTSVKNLGGWLEPAIWNPMYPASNADSTNTPTNFRIVPYGQGFMMWNNWYDTLFITSGAFVGHTPPAITGTVYGPEQPGNVWVSNSNTLVTSIGAWHNPFEGVPQSFTGDSTPSSKLITFTSGATSKTVYPGARNAPITLDTGNSTVAVSGLLVPKPANNKSGSAGTGSAASNYSYVSTNAYTPLADGNYPVGFYFPSDQVDPVPVVYDDPAFYTTGSYGSYPTAERVTGAIWGGIVPGNTTNNPVTQTMTFVLEYQDPSDSSGQTWRPYSRVAKWTGFGQGDMLHAAGIPYQSSTSYNFSAPAPTDFGSPQYSPAEGEPETFHIDPRTDRFSQSSGLTYFIGTTGSYPALTISSRPSMTGTYTASAWPWQTGSCGNPGGASYVYLNPANSWLLHENILSDFFRNLPVGSGTFNSLASYSDPDGWTRPADGALADLASGNGCPIYDGALNQARPVVLNRPFRSVAEMGYAFRDTPFASLDFAPPYAATDSADTALLDFFCVNDTGSTVAGNVNLNAAPQPVIQALLSGAPEDDAVGVSDTLTALETGTIAANLSGTVSTTGGALQTRADLAFLLSQSMQQVGGVIGSANKMCREAPIRALASSADTRTWTFLIDVVAQAGRIPVANASSASASNFIVQGERHYWIQVAIDRFTGKIVGEEAEPVDE